MINCCITRFSHQIHFPITLHMLLSWYKLFRCSFTHNYCMWDIIWFVADEECEEEGTRNSNNRSRGRQATQQDKLDDNKNDMRHTKCFCLASFVICDYMCYRQSFLSAANERTRQYDGTKENSRINAQKYRLLIRYVLGRMTINRSSLTYLESIVNF